MKQPFFYLICFIYSLTARAQVDTTQKVDLTRRNSKEQQDKPYLILISADGFRYDYAKKYKANTLIKLSEEGVRAEFMVPSYPSVTFPNHYSIATGMYPSHHGIVDNKFYDAKRNDFYIVGNRAKVEDGSWYEGTPLWVLAEQQHMLSASFYWVGSEAAIKGIRPTYYYNYTEKIDIDQRVQVVVNWLSLPADRRPHLITFYMPETDHAGHVFGPDSEVMAKAVSFIDSALYKLTEGVKKTGLKNVNYIFLSDHGMTQVDTEHPLGMPAGIDTTKFIIPSGGTQVQLYAKNKADIQPTYQNLKKDTTEYQVYLKTNVPARLHYGERDDLMHRIGDILLIPKWPKVFSFSNKKRNIGWHGYDPSLVKDMLATFYAWGPAFKKHLKIPSFENVNVYPLATQLLGLTYTEKIDGKKELGKKILKKK
jgi:predicted AlkP superfamily pyrophosphatase or phosphodiesterase